MLNKYGNNIGAFILICIDKERISETLRNEPLLSKFLWKLLNCIFKLCTLSGRVLCCFFFSFYLFDLTFVIYYFKENIINKNVIFDCKSSSGSQSWAQSINYDYSDLVQ